MALFSVKVAFAWGGHNKGDFIEHKLDRMQEKLDLTDAQKTAIQQVLESKKAQMETIRDTAQAQIKSQLTPEQAEEFEAMKEKRGKRWGRWGKRGGKHCDKGAEGGSA